MQKEILNSAKINGLLIGGLLSVKFIFSAQNNMILTFLALAISISVVVTLYKIAINFRDQKCEQSISYRHAFSFIFQLYFFGSVIASLVMLVYTQFIDKTYLDTIMNESLKMYEQMGITLDDMSYEIVGLVFKPAAYALVYVFSSVFAGAFWALILAAFVKKEKSIFE